MFPHECCSWYACSEPHALEEITAAYGLPADAVKEGIAYCESNPLQSPMEKLNVPGSRKETKNAINRDYGNVDHDHNKLPPIQ